MTLWAQELELVGRKICAFHKASGMDEAVESFEEVLSAVANISFNCHHAERGLDILINALLGFLACSFSRPDLDAKKIAKAFGEKLVMVVEERLRLQYELFQEMKERSDLF